MLSPLTDKVLVGLAWIRGVHYNVADFFEDVADKAGAIPIIGGGLAKGFNGIAGFFDNLGDEISGVARHVSDISSAIDARLEDLAELWSDVHGWIQDKLDDAYTWAQTAVDQVAGVVDDVGELLYEVFRKIPGRLSSLGSDIGDLLREVFTAIPARFTAMLDEINDRLGITRGEILQIIAPSFNLVEFLREDLTAFFSDPLEFILSRLAGIAKRYEQILLDIVDKIGDALFGD